MAGVIAIIAIIFGSLTVITLGCVLMGTSYSAKKRGLTKGASQREIAALQEQVVAVEKEVATLNKEVKRLIKVAKGVDE